MPGPPVPAARGTRARCSGIGEYTGTGIGRAGLVFLDKYPSIPGPFCTRTRPDRPAYPITGTRTLKPALPVYPLPYTRTLYPIPVPYTLYPTRLKFKKFEFPPLPASSSQTGPGPVK